MGPLSDDQLAWIMTLGPEHSASQAAQIVDCSRQTVLNVRAGKQGAARLEQLRDQPYCINCEYFNRLKGGCLFRFPDVQVHGPAFARDCAMYSRNELLLTDGETAAVAA
jgi:hypothetical protein